ncbi:hypothetical protein M758_9G102000 [Ceratodon purpureus]|nr:hypothetical protein M758_9G102000 [Ceratodon purpureus]
MNRYVGIADDDNSGLSASAESATVEKPRTITTDISGVHKIPRLVNAVSFHVGSINCAHVK